MSRIRYIYISRWLHWVLAVGLIVDIGLGLYGDQLPYAAGRNAARSAMVYSLHKTLGMILLVLALLFALWLVIGDRRPRPAGPVGWFPVLRRYVYWGLFVGMLAMPVTGPVLHGIGPSWGYASTLWPFPDRIPGIPERFATNPVVGAFHVASWWLFAVLTLIHVWAWLRGRWRRAGRSGAVPGRARLRLSPQVLRLAPLAGIVMWLTLAILA